MYLLLFWFSWPYLSVFRTYPWLLTTYSGKAQGIIYGAGLKHISVTCEARALSVVHSFKISYVIYNGIKIKKLSSQECDSTLNYLPWIGEALVVVPRKENRLKIRVRNASINLCKVDACRVTMRIQQ